MKNMPLWCLIGGICFFCACSSDQDPEPEPEPTSPGEIAYHLHTGHSWDTYTINVDGSANARLPLPTTFQHNHHAWSPDGSRLAVQGYSPMSIFTIKVDGSEQRQLTTTSGVTDTEPAWSPSGQQIVFTRFPSTTVNDPEEAELWIMNADGSQVQNLGIKGMFAEWSGDGLRLIYTAQIDKNPEIFTCLADGRAEVRQTQSELFEYRPGWSHSGQKIAFSATTGRADNEAGQEIYVMNADGTNLIKLTDNTAYDGCPQWSADDSLLVFQSERASPGRGDIFVMNADGSNVRQVTRTTAPALAMLPVWRPGR